MAVQTDLMQWRILGDLAPDDRARVLAATTRRTYARDEALVQQGEPGGAFHLIERGRVAVRVSNPTGDIVTLSMLGPGDFFGEQALLGPRHQRTATVVALTTVETLAMDAARFEALRRSNPSVEHFLVEVLAAQVRRLTAHLVEALYVPVEQRALRRLLEMLRHFRTGPPPWVVPITQEDLATMAGTTRPTVNRVLRAMEEAGAVRLARGRIEVLDDDFLRARATPTDFPIVSARTQTGRPARSRMCLTEQVSNREEVT